MQQYILLRSTSNVKPQQHVPAWFLLNVMLLTIHTHTHSQSVCTVCMSMRTWPRWSEGCIHPSSWRAWAWTGCAGAHGWCLSVVTESRPQCSWSGWAPWCATLSRWSHQLHTHVHVENGGENASDYDGINTRILHKTHTCTCIFYLLSWECTSQTCLHSTSYTTSSLLYCITQYW